MEHFAHATRVIACLSEPLWQRHDRGRFRRHRLAKVRADLPDAGRVRAETRKQGGPAGRAQRQLAVRSEEGCARRRETVDVRRLNVLTVGAGDVWPQVVDRDHEYVCSRVHPRMSPWEDTVHQARYVLRDASCTCIYIGVVNL